MAAIACRDVRREFPDVVALDNINLTIETNQIFGLLGPNGCGKTTLLNQIQGLDTPTSGTVEVLGLNPLRDHAELTRRIGSQHQESTSLPRLTIRETITLFSSFYDTTRDPDELIAALSLTEKANSRVEKLSGGQRQRVFIALAMLHNPELLLFDELTSALDPNIRLSIWEILKDLRQQGHTIVLTTHSMEEAHELCDRVAIMNKGRILAEGTPSELVERFAPGSTLRFSASISLDDDHLASIAGVDNVVRDGSDYVISGQGEFVSRVVEELSRAGDSSSSIRTETHTLEDVFLQLTREENA